MTSTYGENLRLSIFGQSHDPLIGMTMTGIPEGLPVDLAQLQAFLQRRAPGRNPWSTPRQESDVPEFREGIRNGKTSGPAITAVIKNQNHHSGDYDDMRHCPRPGHADYSAYVKFGEIPVGGGAFSGRMTAPLCIAGGMCLQWLAAMNIRIGAHILKIGAAEDVAFDAMRPQLEQIGQDFPTLSVDASEEMQAQIATAKADGDSLGGWIECAITGLPAGIGGPLFEGIEGKLAAILYSIPAVKELAFGDTQDYGSENNDAFTAENGRIQTLTNHCGGILGGITNGMPLIFRVRIKPTPSIAQPQQTVDLRTGQVTTVQVTGRHDPCIVPRAVPVVEAVAAIALYDMMLAMQPPKATSIEDLRHHIDRIDSQIAPLFVARMDIAASIGYHKKEAGLPIYDPAREQEKMRKICRNIRPDMTDYVRALYEKIFTLSKGYQNWRFSQKFGLLGEHLSHSYSPLIHAQLCDYVYELFEKKPEELEEFLTQGNFQGLNVTMPYKKAVIPYCSALTPVARMLGAVNTIIRQDNGSLLGHNTDYSGFEQMLHHSGLQVSGKKVLVFGSGGASSTAVAVLKAKGANVIVISRQGENNYQNLHLHADAKVIVNATPVGMYPDTDAVPVDIALFPQLEGVLDLIYNPARTRLIRAAEQKDLVAVNGLWMLVAQAMEASSCFTGQAFPHQYLPMIAQSVMQESENIILIGMPGSGKSTIGKLVAEKLGKEFVDSDDWICQMSGKSIPQIFAEDGEEAFRHLETKVLKDLGKRSGLVIATGGGCVMKPENEEILRQNSRIFWLKRPLDALATEGRTLSQQIGVEALYRIRKEKYAQFADYTIDNCGAPEEAVGEILQLWEDIL